MALSYYQLRKKIAFKLNNPRIMRISLVAFRYFGATMVYHQTRNILLVKKLLGHKRIDNTMKYTQLIEFKDNEYEVATASTLEEGKQVLTTEFDSVTEKMEYIFPDYYGVFVAFFGSSIMVDGSHGLLFSSAHAPVSARAWRASKDGQ